ncbi:ABC transporter permease [Hoeflea sp. TYP-13]|uniref:ABC transporter permease n=1 Tax=Hoeflea sp. TYP-13 TaxID=3230023 RepID=UPI0034C68294
MINEIRLLIDNYPIWSYLSYSDIKSRFRRSKLGVVWQVVNQLAFSVGAGLIWSAVFNLDPAEFIPFLTMGFAVWGFISASPVEGCSAFVNAHGYLKQLPLSPSIFVFRTLFTQLIYLAIGLATALAVLAYFQKLTLLGALLTLPGLLLLILYSYGAIGSFAYLGLRYRDLQHGLASLFSLLFVVTPVIYPAEVLIQRGLGMAVYVNPFASLIEIVRYPILQGEFAHFNHYLVSFAFVFVLLMLRAILKFRFERYIPFLS